MTDSSKPYPPKTVWRFTNKRSGHDFETTLRYRWEANYSSMSDDYEPADIDAPALWRKWVDALHRKDGFDKDFGPGWVRIYWYVEGPDAATFELASHSLLPSEWPVRDEQSFLTHFTNPIVISTGEPMNWARLPVADMKWRHAEFNKGGFIQEALGWKPGALQPVMHVPSMARAGGLYWPTSTTAH